MAQLPGLTPRTPSATERTKHRPEIKDTYLKSPQREAQSKAESTANPGVPTEAPSSDSILQASLWQRFENALLFFDPAIEWFFRLKGTKTHIDLTDAEQRILRCFADKIHAEHLTNAQLLQFLVTTPINPDNFEHRQALVSLGLLSPFLNACIDIFCAQGKPLRGVRLLYNGHLTVPTVNLFQMAEALGLEHGTVHATSHNTRFQAKGPLEGILRQKSLFCLDGEATDELPESPTDNVLRRVENQLFYARKRQEILFIDKPKELLSQDLPPNIRRSIECGEIRFLIHNSTDYAAFEKNRSKFSQVYAADIRSSLLKKFEERIVAESTVQIAAREVMQKWHKNLCDTKIVVKGYGSIGRSTVRALRRLGIEGRNITVIEPNAGRRRSAAKSVGQVLTKDERNDDEHAVVFVATSGKPTITRQNAALFAKNTMYFSYVSGGNGVDVTDIHEVAAKAHAAHRPKNTRHSPTLYDMNFDLPFGAENRHVTLINCLRVDDANELFVQCPVNLSEDPTPTRNGVTATAVLAAAIELAQRKSPGIFVPSMGLQKRVLRCARHYGLHRMSPIKPRLQILGAGRAELIDDPQSLIP
ncbi:MAG: hypothetical protein R3C68_00535 [Myxococcota bacterium]